MPKGDNSSPSVINQSSPYMIGIVQAALASAGTGGTTWNYFTGPEGIWRASASQMGASLATQLRTASPQSLMSQSVSLLTTVNANFRTRQAIKDLPHIAQSSFVELKHALVTGLPLVLGATDTDRASIAAAYMAALRQCIPPAVIGRPFALLSKWLHILFPDVFAIYDKNAAKSIKAWSDQEYEHLADFQRLQFDINNRQWVVHWDDPVWYEGILLFYQKFWDCAQITGCHIQLQAAAQQLQLAVRSASGCSGAIVTVCDLIDCHLWRSNGNSAKLGTKLGGSVE